MSSATSWVAVLASVLVSSTPLLSTEPIAEVPFELYQHHLVVAKGSIGRLNGLNLLIDTGTIPSMVDSRIARKLHMQPESSMLVAFGQQVQIQSGVWKDSASAPCSRPRYPPVSATSLTWKASASTPSLGLTCWRARTSASTIGPAC